MDTTRAEPLSELAAGNARNQHMHKPDNHNSLTNNYDLLIAKCTAMLVLFFASTLCGSLPFMLNRHFKWIDIDLDARSATYIKSLLYFGGGVLLCTTYIHLLPEVQQAVSNLVDCGVIPKFHFPVAELLMCFGFFAMFFVEELTFSLHKYYNPDETKCQSSSSAVDSGVDIKHSAQDLEDQTIKLKIIKSETDNSHHNVLRSGSNGHAHSHLPISARNDENTKDIASALRGLVMLLALSLHELIEGMTIGLEASTNHVWFMFGAVSVHKLVLAFCLAVELIVSRTRLTLSMIYVITFAIVSPIGIGVGILVSHHGDTTTASIPSVILQGLASGTLLYVVFFEILSKDHSGILPLLVFLVGFLVMFALELIFSHEHSHSHSCDISNNSTHIDHTHHHHH